MNVLKKTTQHAHFCVYANLPNTNKVRLAGKQTPLLEGSFSFVPKISYGLRGALRSLEPVLFSCMRTQIILPSTRASKPKTKV